MVNRLWQYFQWMLIFLERNHFVGFVVLLLAIVITGCNTVKDSDPLQAVAIVYSEVITTGMLREREIEDNE